jgi:hypothetical protein
VAVENPAGEPVPNAQIDFSLYPGASSAGTVNASQVHLTYSTTGAGGPFIAIPLTGDTANGDSITGYPGPLEGTPLAPKSTVTYTFHLALDASVPEESGDHPLLDIEAYLEQIDSASGSGTVLDDSYASDLHVTH